MYSSSQPPQGFSHHLPIAKYSHTSTSAGLNGPLNWNHIIDNGDLMLSMTDSCGRTMLNVFRNHDVLVRFSELHTFRQRYTDTSHTGANRYYSSHS